MKTLQILKNEDMWIFDAPPELESENPKYFFHLEGLYNARSAFRKPVNKVGFIIQRSYFSASRPSDHIAVKSANFENAHFWLHVGLPILHYALFFGYGFY